MIDFCSPGKRRLESRETQGFDQFVDELQQGFKLLLQPNAFSRLKRSDSSCISHGPRPRKRIFFQASRPESLVPNSSLKMQDLLRRGVYIQANSGAGDFSGK